MPRNSAGIFFYVLMASGALAPSAAAVPLGSPLATEALARCREADWLVGEKREQLLREGLRLAEQAVAADDSDAAAHFALFCNLGKRLQAAGIGISILMDVRRVRREIDRAIELAPRDPDLWAAKGALLLNLPPFLGGDRVKAESLLVRAFVADPESRATRVYLYQALE